MDLTRRKPEQQGHLDSPQQPCDISVPRPGQDLGSAYHCCKGLQASPPVKYLTLFHTPLVETMPACEKLKLPVESWYLKIWIKPARFMGNNSLGSMRNQKKKRDVKFWIKKEYPTGKYCISNVSKDETGN